MIDVSVHPDSRNKYVITVRDPGNSEILLSSTSQGYEDIRNPLGVVQRLFGGPHAAGVAASANDPEPDPAAYVAGGAGQPEPVQVTVTYTDGTVVGPTRIR